MASKRKRSTPTTTSAGASGTRTGDKGAGRSRGALGAPMRRKSCNLCRDKVAEVDYKNIDLLRRYMSDRARIRSRRMTGACRRHQRQVAVAIKRAREMALLPYVGASDAPASRSRSSSRR
ncbi:MAG: 30S ribosomal protein S18 [Gaiella sp.]